MITDSRFLAFVSITIAVWISCCTFAHAQNATVREDQKTFRTYPFSDPNPVARMGNIYPYFRFEGYSAEPILKEWKVVTLENQFIKVMVAPEIGGKILGAFEKSSGRAFIYFNKVVKFREIAMRGPWTSGGVEFNFGEIGHAPSTATPVDYTTRVNPDGSASCIVGTIDLPSRTEWRVEIRIPKDKAYVETRSFWYNPTELPTSLYHWMNAAADADSDLYFIYPGVAHIDHGGVASSWPIDRDGRDLSRYRNNAFGPSKSYHVLGTYTDFFGLGWKDRDFGVVHWADYAEKPGKKLWLWALSREGGIWTDLLTDTDLGNSQYVEFQSGLLFNQALPNSTFTPFKHREFAPCSEERFTDAWFPFKGIGGVTQANLHAALNVERHGSKIVFGICPLEPIREELVITSGSTHLYQRTLSLKSMQTFTDSVSVPENSDYVVQLGSLLEYGSEDARLRTLERPREINKSFDWKSIEGVAVNATDEARQRNYTHALELYNACLSRDSLYSPALVGAAEVLYRQMELDKALASIRKVLSNDTYDPAANYFYGVIQRQRGRLYDAMDGFGDAARSVQYRSAANTELAEIAGLRGKWDQSIEYADRALDYDRYNIRAMKIRAVAFRKSGQQENARAAQAEILRCDPLSHFAHAEQYLSHPGEKTRQSLISSIHTELPAEVYLEIAAYYYGLGQLHDALESLTFAPPHPIICFWKAFLDSKLGKNQEASTLLRMGTELSTYLVFPHRRETAEVLSWARTRSDHWTIHYYLGLILWNIGRADDARQEMALCGNRPTEAQFFVTRGNLFRGINDSLALLDYKKGVDIGPDEWRTYSALAAFYTEHAQYGNALNTLGAGSKQFPGHYVLQFDHARGLLYDRQYSACLSILDTLTILPFEGAGYGRELHRQAAVLASTEAIRNGKYTKALLLVGKAREWPERLGVGKPYETDCRIEDYLEAICKSRMGDSASAARLFRNIVDQSSTYKERDAQYLVQIMALQKLGLSDRASKTLQTWAEDEPANPVAGWAMKTLTGEKPKASRIFDDQSEQWNPIPSDPNFPIVKEIATLSMEQL